MQKKLLIIAAAMLLGMGVQEGCYILKVGKTVRKVTLR